MCALGTRRYRHGMSSLPKVLDGATVVATADLAGVRATGSVRLYADGQFQDSNSFAHLALATYGPEEGWYVFYCDDGWNVLNDMFYDYREEAEAHVRDQFVGVRFVEREP